ATVGAAACGANFTGSRGEGRRWGEWCAEQRRVVWAHSCPAYRCCECAESARSRYCTASPSPTAAKIAQSCSSSMGTSETPGQLTIRLEMGQGRPVHLFIAPAELACQGMRGFIFCGGRRGVFYRSGLAQ